LIDRRIDYAISNTEICKSHKRVTTWILSVVGFVNNTYSSI